MIKDAETKRIKKTADTRHTTPTGLFICIALALIVLVISGCQGANTGNNYQRKYYQGYDSLDIRFSDEAPPNTFYYDPEGADNEIPIVVEVKNKGSSDAFGAIYIHGYDPHIMQIAGGKKPGPSNVRINDNNGAFSFDLGGIYVGIRADRSTGKWQGGVDVGFRSPNGQVYGGSVFGEEGNVVKGFSVIIDTRRIGSGLGRQVLKLYSQAFGYNSMIALKGDTPETPGGDLEVYEFPTYIYYLPPSLDEFRQPIMVTACYGYATRATAMMCVDPRPNSNVKKACKPLPVSLSSGQGAPVAVTRVEQHASTRKTVFTIYVKHSRKNNLDDLFDYESLGKCDPDSGQIVKASDKNVVYIGYIALSGQDITAGCVPDRRIRLDESGNGQISCSIELDGAAESAYQAPLEMELWYGYSKSVYKTITIKRI